MKIGFQTWIGYFSVILAVHLLLLTIVIYVYYDRYFLLKALFILEYLVKNCSYILDFFIWIALELINYIRSYSNQTSIVILIWISRKTVEDLSNKNMCMFLNLYFRTSLLSICPTCYFLDIVTLYEKQFYLYSDTAALKN